MTPVRGPAVLAVVLAAAAASARADDQPDPGLPVDVTATTSAGWHTDRDYGEVFGRLNASSTWQDWHAALRVDTATFIEPPEPEVDDRYTLEKVTAGWTGRAVEVSAGDAYVSFGRGLGLSIRKIDELGIDTTLRGGKLLLHQGDLSATVAAGYANINNVDEATGTGADDPYDLIAGAQAQVLLLDKVNVGGYAAGVAFRDPLGLVPTDDYTDRTTVVGVMVDAPRLTEQFGFYLEGVEQELRTDPAAERPRGFGLYGTATGNLEPVTLLFEGKAYGALTPLAPNLEEPAFAAVAYNSPPTVERVQQIIENPATEIAGGRLRADWTVRPGVILHANAAFFRDWLGYADPGSGELEPGSIVDPYAGAELRWDESRSWVIGSAGWRAVLLDDAGVVRRDAHGEIEAAQAFGDRFSVTLQAVHLERRKRDVLLDEKFREGTLLAGLRVQPALTVAAGYDYTTEPIQPHTHYLNGQLGWDFTPSSGLRLFAGSARGGLKCVSGVCRQVPPFEGVKLTATIRF